MNNVTKTDGINIFIIIIIIVYNFLMIIRGTNT